ncbi:MAG: ferrous iron transport protein B [Clostridia bacterium]|nr:ferrous iron transport protein B [Clostridia bacterium]
MDKFLLPSDEVFKVKMKDKNDYVIALAGNPNVGKSTVFNALTGMRQHTGNWPGKTVTCAQGSFNCGGIPCVLVDLPGTYSLLSHSAEEETARDFICFGKADAVIVVCDATCMERNLNLVLQILEVTDKVIVCVNLMDEARRCNIQPNLEKLEQLLKVPVVGAAARSKKGIEELKAALAKLLSAEQKKECFKVKYPEKIEKNVSLIEPYVEDVYGSKVNSRWISLRLMSREYTVIDSLNRNLRQADAAAVDISIEEKEYIRSGVPAAELLACLVSHMPENADDLIVSSIFGSASEISSEIYEGRSLHRRNKKADKFFTGKFTGIPVMFMLLCVVLWITIVGANYPSAFLSDLLLGFEDNIIGFLAFLGAPKWLQSFLAEGVYRVLAWVVSVMLPPMAIFFPLFTILEDSGYLPRVAFNLDHCFKKAGACGKQSLTHCMGFGCNAVGVTGCRIIDSPRERMIAILTNSFAPCNGRFPMIVTVISVFFAIASYELLNSVLAAAIIAVVIVIGIAAVFLVSKLLSKTLLKGVPSSFAMELPPYRTPQFGKVIVRSIFDRTLFVLGRAVAVAAPAGAVIWIMSNMHAGAANMSILEICADVLDPFAKLMGLDGVILIAFILGFPANEIVIPIMIMAYTASGTLTDAGSISAVKELFTANGWDWTTAICVIIFCLMHWPCSTTCITIKKETGSFKWTLLAVAIPTVCGIIACMAFNAVVTLLGF